MWEKYSEALKKNKKIDPNWIILGIDLGTTHSVISWFNPVTKRPEPIDMSQGFGKIPLPSVVQLRTEGGNSEWVIGEEAYRSMQMYPETTVLSIKRKMGCMDETQLGGQKYLPEALSAMILKELLGHITLMNPNGIIVGAVVSVPYDFDDAAKKATIRACQLAGLGDALICLIEEPKAAALSYSFRHEFSENEKILIFDFGGGTLDITVFQVLKRSEKEIHLKVISEGGEAYHGGDNIDGTLLSQLYAAVEKETGLNKAQVTLENSAQLLQSARELKERLSGVKSFRVPFTFCNPPFMQAFTRAQMEDAIEPFINKTRQLVLRTLSDAYNGALKPSDIDKILLEGGSSTMPWVKDMLISVFNDYEKVICSDQPALDIAMGATYYAAIKMGLLNHPDMLTLGDPIGFDVVVPHDIGFEVDYGHKKEFFTMIGRGTPYALAKKTQLFTLKGRNEQELSELTMRILERMHKGDKIERCKLIGVVQIKGIPTLKDGDGQIRVTLIAEEESGIIKGKVEDLSGAFVAHFSPERTITTTIIAQ